MNTLQSLMKAVMQNETLIAGYASSKCKDCLGRGYVEIKAPEEFHANNYLCNCVVKKVKKEFHESQ